MHKGGRSAPGKSTKHGYRMAPFEWTGDQVPLFGALRMSMGLLMFFSAGVLGSFGPVANVYGCHVRQSSSVSSVTCGLEDVEIKHGSDGMSIV